MFENVYNSFIQASKIINDNPSDVNKIAIGPNTEHSPSDYFVNTAISQIHGDNLAQIPFDSPLSVEDISLEFERENRRYAHLLDTEWERKLY